MSPELIPLYERMTVDEALDAIRRDGGAAETVYTLPVRDGAGRLAGTVELLELVLAAPERRLDELADRTFPAVSASTDQEAVGRLMQAADLVAVPRRTGPAHSSSASRACGDKRARRSGRALVDGSGSAIPRRA